MTHKNLNNHLQFAHSLWEQSLQHGDVAVDMTCGNGYDSLKIASLILKADQGSLISIDRQDQALANTRERLKRHLHPSLLARVHLHLGCHSRPPDLPRPIKLICYNLGYLPGSDKTITTEPATTITSLRWSLSHISCGGSITLICYVGHQAGKLEAQQLLPFVRSLFDQQGQGGYPRYQIILKENRLAVYAPIFINIKKLL